MTRAKPRARGRTNLRPMPRRDLVTWARRNVRGEVAGLEVGSTRLALAVLRMSDEIAMLKDAYAMLSVRYEVTSQEHIAELRELRDRLDDQGP